MEKLSEGASRDGQPQTNQNRARLWISHRTSATPSGRDRRAPLPWYTCTPPPPPPSMCPTCCANPQAPWWRTCKCIQRPPTNSSRDASPHCPCSPEVCGPHGWCKVDRSSERALPTIPLARPSATSPSDRTYECAAASENRTCNTSTQACLWHKHPARSVAPSRRGDRVVQTSAPKKQLNGAQASSSKAFLRARLRKHRPTSHAN